MTCRAELQVIKKPPALPWREAQLQAEMQHCYAVKVIQQLSQCRGDGFCLCSDEPGLPVQPGAHKSVQSAAASLPADDVRPGAQASHTLEVLAPTSLEYLPAAQSWQSSPRPALSPYLPASHSMHARLDV